MREALKYVALYIGALAVAAVVFFFIGMGLRLVVEAVQGCGA